MFFMSFYPRLLHFYRYQLRLIKVGGNKSYILPPPVEAGRRLKRLKKQGVLQYKGRNFLSVWVEFVLIASGVIGVWAELAITMIGGVK